VTFGLPGPNDRVIPLDRLRLSPEEERLLRQAVVVRTGHDRRECVDAMELAEWLEHILGRSGDGEGRGPA
jgi:hypothetical protein